MKAMWQSSNLTAPNCEFKIADMDGDKKDDLIVIEGSYSTWPQCDGDHIAIWKWNGWGFSSEWRSSKGKYNNLSIEQLNSKSVIGSESK